MLNMLNNLLLANQDASATFKVKSKKKVTKLGRLPMFFPMNKYERSDSVALLKYSRKANKYIAYQEKRITNHIVSGNYNKAVFIWMLLLKSSISYQLILMNRTIPNWYYEFSKEEVHKFFMELRRKCAKWDMKLTLKRFYLDKGMEKEGIPNNKFRPIGAPTLISRVISKAFTDMTYFIHEKDMKPFQHGYRLDKGCYSALFEVWKKIFVEKEEHIYEFDFKSFFNTVRPSTVYDALSRKSTILADQIDFIIKRIAYVFDEIKEEAELKVIGKKAKWKVKPGDKKPTMTLKPWLKRSGLPQGLSMSPLLSSLALEITNYPKNLVMYADDGLIFGDTPEKDAWFKRLQGWYNIMVCVEKTGKIGKSFRFLGTDWNIEEKWVRYEDHYLRWTDREIELGDYERIRKWFLHVASIYGDKPTAWTWNIKDQSWIEDYAVPLKGYKKLAAWLYEQFIIKSANVNGEVIQKQVPFGYRLFLKEITKDFLINLSPKTMEWNNLLNQKPIYSISGSSSKCCAGFLKRINELNTDPNIIREERVEVTNIKLSRKQYEELMRLKDRSKDLYESYLDMLVQEEKVKVNKKKVSKKINKLGRLKVKSKDVKYIVKPNTLNFVNGINHPKYVIMELGQESYVYW